MEEMVTFDKAFIALKAGFNVYRKAWTDTGGKFTILYFRESASTNIKEFNDYQEVIMARLWTGQKVTWIAMPTDLTATDWIIQK